MPTQAKHLLETSDLLLGFRKMRLKCLLQLRIIGFFGHVGKRLQDLILGVVDVAQRMHEQIVHSLDIFGKEAHGAKSSGWSLMACSN